MGRGMGGLAKPAGQAVDSRDFVSVDVSGQPALDPTNFRGLVLGGGGRPDYLQKLKVPEGYEKMIDYSNI